MSLAIFDLDDTLTYRDTESLWVEYLVSKKILKDDVVKLKQKEFLSDYASGKLNFQDVIQFSLGKLSHLSLPEQQEMRKDFVDKKLKHYIIPEAVELVQSHLKQGHTTIIISAGHEFLIHLAKDFFPVHDCLCTELERGVNGEYLPIIKGLPIYRHQKVIKLLSWLTKNNYSFPETHFYSDSINDFPLLSWVDYPVAVNPCPALLKQAKERGWPILNFKMAQIVQDNQAL